MLAGDLLEDGTDWELADLTGCPDLSSRASISGEHGRCFETCLVLSRSFLSSVAFLMSMAVRSVEEMSRESLLEVHVGALESVLSPTSTGIGK